MSRACKNSTASYDWSDSATAMTWQHGLSFCRGTKHVHEHFIPFACFDLKSVTRQTSCRLVFDETRNVVESPVTDTISFLTTKSSTSQRNEFRTFFVACPGFPQSPRMSLKCFSSFSKRSSTKRSGFDSRIRSRLSDALTDSATLCVV